RLSSRSFAANAVRLQLHALAYNLGNFLRTLATPEPIKDWSLTSLKEKLIKIGAKLVSHGRYVAFQMAEVAIPRSLFAEILQRTAELGPPRDPASAGGGRLKEFQQHPGERCALRMGTGPWAARNARRCRSRQEAPAVTVAQRPSVCHIRPRSLL